MAQMIDHTSHPSSKSEIDLFTVPSTQVAVEKGSWYNVHPVNTVTDIGPYEFHIPPDPHYLDLNNNYILVQFKILLANGQDITNEAVGPINLIGKTFFKQVKLFLSSKMVYDSGDTYAYRAFLETELSHGWQPKKTLLVAAGYQTDEPANHVDDVLNVGLQGRTAWFANGGVVEMMAPLHVDLFHQEKYLLNRMDLRLELYRNSDNFSLMAFDGAQYRLKVVNINWMVRRIDLMPSVSLAIESTLQKTAAKYPVRRVSIKAIQLEAGRRDTPTNTLFDGQIPRRIIVGCVGSTAFHGAINRSPFNFKNLDATSIQVTAGGVSYPANPLTMDFGNGRFTQAFVQLYEALGLSGTDRSCWLDMDDYRNSSCLYAFDLTPDTADGGHWELIHEGSTTIHMTFGTAIPAGGVKLIVLAEFDNLITIDKFRNVFNDYTP